MKKLFAVLSLLLLTPTVAEAKAEKYIFDPVHTQISFSVDHLGFSHPHGRFLKFDGGFTFDPDHPENSQVDVTISTDSIDMCSPEWDRSMKGSNFFDVKKFPAMTFKSVKVEKSTAKQGKLTGELTLRGVTKPVTLDVVYNRSGVHPLNRNFIAGFSATATIKRADFGMDYGLPGIGDEVNIDIQVEGIRQDFGGINNK